MIVDVESRVGHLQVEEPSSFVEGERVILVTEIVDRWLGSDHSYFKVLDGRGDVHLLRHDLVALVWETVEMGLNRPAAMAPRRQAWRRVRP